jgi:hypothetical protein
VLAWLAPEFNKYLIYYYDIDGQSMDGLFLNHQIEHLDVMYAQILKNMLDNHFEMKKNEII